MSKKLKPEEYEEIIAMLLFALETLHDKAYDFFIAPFSKKLKGKLPNQDI